MFQNQQLQFLHSLRQGSMKKTPVRRLTIKTDIGTYPTGIVYADKQNEEYGDYKRLAFLSFKSFKLTLYNCPKDLKEEIEKDAQKLLIKKVKNMKFHLATSM